MNLTHQLFFPSFAYSYFSFYLFSRADFIYRGHSQQIERRMERKVFADGSSYEGEMKDNRFHGKGVFTLPDGVTMSGNFINGRPDGKIVVSLSNGSVFGSSYFTIYNKVDEDD